MVGDGIYARREGISQTWQDPKSTFFFPFMPLPVNGLQDLLDMSARRLTAFTLYVIYAIYLNLS